MNYVSLFNKMSVVIFALIALAVSSDGFLIKVPTSPVQPKISSSGWVHMQKLILPLFENVCDASTNPTIVRLAQEFGTDASSGVYLKPEVVTNLQSLRTGKGLLAKHVIFTEYNADYLNELKTIYEVLFYAKDFDTFYNAAAWARQTLNCGLFVDAVYLAVLNRRDTARLSIPAPYEILPNYFIRKDVIIKASSILSGEEIILSDDVRGEGNSYMLDVNYTANYIENDAESKLAYFHEDVGLNSYYFLKKLKNAPWFNTRTVMSIGYGEYLYHTIKQLAARYNLERYANNLPEVETLNLESLSANPYDPMLIYSDGEEFGQRNKKIDFSDDESVQMLKTIENNISIAVNRMVSSGYNKSQIINQLMDILVTSDKSFENVARKIIGKDSSEMNLSVLDHYLTSLRDPAIWRINQHIVSLVDNAIKVLPAYTRSDIYFPGIEVLNIDIKKPMTTFDSYVIDVTEALKTAETDTTYQVKIIQPRLNHKPFVIKLNISSLVSQKGMIKLYLAPKVAPGELTMNKNNFMLLDCFEYTFKTGINIVSRASEEMRFSPDFDSLKALQKKVEDAEFGLDVLPFENIERFAYFPSRLILPKGTSEGLPLQIFTFVAPFNKATVGSLFSLAATEFNSAILSPGYPLDLNIQDTNLFLLPNVMVKDILVTHKGDKVSSYGGESGDKKWKSGGGSYDPLSRPTFNKQPFDYTLKKGQFEKKDDNPKKQEVFKTDQNNIIISKDPNKPKVPELNEDTILKEISELASKMEIKYDQIKKIDSEDKNVDAGDTGKLNNTPLDKDIFAQTLAPASVLLVKRTPTVYDYLLPTFDYDDDTDEKVYE